MKNNPYIGPRPYERKDSENFYGRNREARDLLSLILAERVVLFYAQSGAGKTSLLNAKILPALEEEGFHVLPVARVSGDPPAGMDAGTIGNIFVFSVLMSLADKNVPAETLRPHTLLTFLQAYYPQQQDDFGGARPLLIIFDQFEELFTTHRDRWQEAQGFFEQVRGALEAIPSLGVVFSMREDHVAELDPYAYLIPRRLRARFRIERLGPAGALEAITRPALNAGCAFDAGVAEQLVDNLRRIKVQRAPGLPDEEAAILGPFVEPVQFQVVCQRLWENLPEQEDRLIQWEEVERFGNIDRALIDFYESAVIAVAAETGEREKVLRRWFGEHLITPMQTRGLVLRGQDETEGLPNAAVDALTRHYLIRSEVRAGAWWYELVHDRLIDPILQSNQVWEAARQTPLHTAAKRWRDTQEAGLLYREAALQEALAWAAAHPDDVEPYEHDFLETSRQAQQARIRQRWLRITATALGIVTFFIIASLAWLAGRSSLMAYTKEWAAKSQYARAIDQEGSIAMAREAIRRDQISPLLRAARPLLGQVDTTDAEVALREALLDFYPAQVFERIGDGTALNDLVYSADNRFLYAGFSNNEIWIWDRGLQKAERLRAAGPVFALAYNPAADVLAVGGDDGKPGYDGIVRLWDVQSGEWRQSLQVPTPAGLYDTIYALAYSPDGRYLATGGDYGPRSRDTTRLRNAGMLRVWDIAAGRAVTLTGHTGRVTGVAFSSDGRYLASGSTDGTVRLWELSTDARGVVTATASLTLTGHTDQVLSVAFSPSEPLLATASADKTIRLWELAPDSEPPAAKAVATLVGHKREVTRLAFSDDGNYLLSGSRDATVRLWNVAARNTNAVFALTGHTNVVQGIDFSHDGRYIATGDGVGDVRIWDQTFLKDQKLSTLTGHNARVRQIAFSPDGLFLASGDSGGEAVLWSLRNGQIVHRFPPTAGDIWGVTYSPGGEFLVTCSGDHNVRVWDAATGALVKLLEAHTADANRAAYSPDGRFLVTAGDDSRAIIWDTATWQIVRELKGAGAFYDVAYSPDGRFIAAGSTDRNVRLWEVAPTDEGGLVVSDLHTLGGHTDQVFSVAFSPDGKVLVSGAWDKTVRFWSTETYTTAGQSLELQEYVYSAVYSPDGKYLATGSRDNMVYLFDMEHFPKEAPRIVGRFAAHTDIVWSVAFSPDGKTLASGSWDRTIRRYPVRFEDVWALSESYLP